jgi:hypothetical protein
MRWDRKWTEKPSQMEMALGEAAGHRLIEITPAGAGAAVHYVWVKGGTVTRTNPDGTTRKLRIWRRVGTG